MPGAAPPHARSMVPGWRTSAWSPFGRARAGIVATDLARRDDPGECWSACRRWSGVSRANASSWARSMSRGRGLQHVSIALERLLVGQLPMASVNGLIVCDQKTTFEPPCRSTSRWDPDLHVQCAPDPAFSGPPPERIHARADEAERPIDRRAPRRGAVLSAIERGDRPYSLLSQPSPSSSASSM